MKKLTMNDSVAIIGGGAAGMMAAGIAAASGARVVLLEQNSFLGKKLNITGKGRCNITNDCDVETFLANVTRNARFLYSAASRFSPRDAIEFFEKLGVPLKIERGRRVFPESDRAREVTDALKGYLERNNVDLRHERVRELILEEGAVRGVRTVSCDIPCRAAVIATGGVSYPATGSTGDGFKLARQAGHTVTELSGSLVPLTADPELCSGLTGLTLKNIKLTLLTEAGGLRYQEQGEMLFTHFGVSGPLVLSASAHMRQDESYHISLDLKPALDERKLDLRLLRDFESQPNRTIRNVLGGLLPARLVSAVELLAEIPPGIKVNQFSKDARRELISVLKDFRINITGQRQVSEAVVTRGGVSIAEVSPKSMESKLIKGLYFAGEVLDLDAYTGGYNLQIAWSTGYAAGVACCVTT